MKRSTGFVMGVSALALAASAFSTSSDARQIFYPHARGAMPADPNQPYLHVGGHEAPYVAPPSTRSGTWKDIAGALPFTSGPWAPMLLTDGTVIVEDYCTSQWYKLTPDKKGRYTTGTWSAIAPMPLGYSPYAFAQQILPDGRVIINGGEENGSSCEAVWTNQGALYDPVANSWTTVSPPGGWSEIGDAQSIILPNGTYMLADCCQKEDGQFALASISGTTVTWSIVNGWSCPPRDPCNEESALTPLPNGTLQLVDTWNHGTDYNETWIYQPSTQTWTQGPNTASLLSSPYAEIGAAVLRPDGIIIQFGADLDGDNNLYDTKTGDWMIAASFALDHYVCSDAPAALLPDGNVLVQASPANVAPSHFFEFSLSKKTLQTGGRLTQVNDTTQAPGTASWQSNMLDLPTGQVLWDNSWASTKEVAVYTPHGKPKNSWLPVVSSVSDTLAVGSKGNAISGTNFNGFSLGGAYGDDAQQSTNYPLVRITNARTSDVCYTRSYNFSTMGVFTQGTTNAEFDIPKKCETGPGTLQVIVNGIASSGTSVTLD